MICIGSTPDPNPTPDPDPTKKVYAPTPDPDLTPAISMVLYTVGKHVHNQRQTGNDDIHICRRLY